MHTIEIIGLFGLIAVPAVYAAIKFWFIEKRRHIAKVIDLAEGKGQSK